MAFIEPMHRNKPNITYLLTFKAQITVSNMYQILPFLIFKWPWFTRSDLDGLMQALTDWMRNITCGCQPILAMTFSWEIVACVNHMLPMVTTVTLDSSSGKVA